MKILVKSSYLILLAFTVFLNFQLATGAWFPDGVRVRCLLIHLQYFRLIIRETLDFWSDSHVELIPEVKFQMLPV